MSDGRKRGYHWKDPTRVSKKVCELCCDLSERRVVGEVADLPNGAWVRWGSKTPQIVDPATGLCRGCGLGFSRDKIEPTEMLGSSGGTLTDVGKVFGGESMHYDSCRKQVQNDNLPKSNNYSYGRRKR